MLRIQQILVSAIVLASSVAGLCACGQQGPLYLPTEPATQPQPHSSANRPPAPATQSPLQ